MSGRQKPIEISSEQAVEAIENNIPVKEIVAQASELTPKLTPHRTHVPFTDKEKSEHIIRTLQRQVSDMTKKLELSERRERDLDLNVSRLNSIITNQRTEIDRLKMINRSLGGKDN